MDVGGGGDGKQKRQTECLSLPRSSGQEEYTSEDLLPAKHVSLFVVRLLPEWEQKVERRQMGRGRRRGGV